MAYTNLPYWGKPPRVGSERCPQILDQGGNGLKAKQYRPLSFPSFSRSKVLNKFNKSFIKSLQSFELKIEANCAQQEACIIKLFFTAVINSVT
jgi:hypothetical protein